MPDTFTPNYNFLKIDPGTRKDTWGAGLNGVLDAIDAALKGVDNKTAIAAILTALLTVDGAGSGLDADKLDGNDSAYFATAAQVTAAAILTALLTVDGAGSGLDADKLDGNDSAYFAVAAHNHDGSYLKIDGSVETTGPLKMNASGGYLFHVDNAMNNGRVFIQAAGGADPTSQPGDVLLEY